MIDTSRFTIPNIQTVEVLAPAAGGLPVQIQPDQFRHRGRRWVKRFILSATDFMDQWPTGNANTQWLNSITGRWWVRMREEASGVLATLPNFDTGRWERSLVEAALGGGPITYSVAWDFDHDFEIPNNDTMFVQICNRARVLGANIVAAGTVNFAVHGYGKETGKHRMLQLPAQWPLMVAANQRLMVTAPTIQNAVNQFGESIIAKRLVISTDTTAMALVDSRLFNHITARVYFEPGAHVSLTGPDINEFVPLLAYGSSRNLEGHVVIFDLDGDPLITEDSEAVGWEFQSAVAGFIERVQVSVVSLLER